MEQHIDNPIITERPSLDMTPVEYFRLAKAFADTNYRDMIDRISNTHFDQLLPETFFTEYIWCVYTSGFNAKVVSKMFPKLMNAYAPLNDWLIEPNQRHPDFDVISQKALAICKNKRKVGAILQTSDILHGEMDKWSEYRDAHLDTPEKLQELPFVGPITCYHLARNIGLLQYIKPDLHLVRMAKHWGYDHPVELCDELSKQYGLQPGIVDLILWLGASTFGTK